MWVKQVWIVKKKIEARKAEGSLDETIKGFQREQSVTALDALYIILYKIQIIYDHLGFEY